MIHELGLLEDFLKLPHQKAESFSMTVGGKPIRFLDLTHAPTHCKFIALMPQWDFLNFLAGQGRRYPTFDLHMRTEAVQLLEESGRVVGVEAKTPDGAITINADLTVACDGRHSVLRSLAGLRSEQYGAPMDVLWFRISRKQSDSGETLGRLEAGGMLVMLYRGDYWQCAYVIPKGGADHVKEAGMEAFRCRVVELAPFLADRMGELRSFDDVKLLNVTVDLLQRWWRPGLLCIGDAAHAMSPIGGVGINIAVQDAVAAANQLAAPLRNGHVTDADLQAIQRRRMLPAQLTQRVQLMLQNRMVSQALQTKRAAKPPLLLSLVNAFPLLRRIPARLLAVGFRPEHVRTADAFAVREGRPVVSA